MLESSAEERAPKPKCVRKKADPNTSPKQKPLNNLSWLPKEARHNFIILTQVAQVMELTLSQRFLMSSNKSSGTNEGTGTIPGVPNVPIYESESEKEYWGDSDEEDDDEDDFDDDSDDN
ncbi:hypothetical protein Tco_0314189, partial [Tanacetum coccineum]